MTLSSSRTTGQSPVVPTSTLASFSTLAEHLGLVPAPLLLRRNVPQPVRRPLEPNVEEVQVEPGH